MSSTIMNSVYNFLFREIHPFATSLILAPLLLIIVSIAVQIQLKIQASRKTAKEGIPYRDIEPLSKFDWKNEEPLKLRPFKPKYHLTMAIQNTTFSDLIAMDKTYLSRVQLRRELMHKHGEAIVSANPVSADSVAELYEWMMGTYLPHRFPSLFVLISPPVASNPEKGRTLYLRNKITNESLPATAPKDPMKALVTLGANIDTDFLFLLPSDDGEKYTLEAFVTCFPNGFSTKQKLGLPLADIHFPVPSYGDRLEKSMDRYFASMPVGKVVKRANWAVSTDDQLFVESGNHMAHDESQDMDAEIDRQRDSVKVEDCRLRCERQTLHRLPETNVMVFAFKTYQYMLDEVKDEGSGEEMASAIEGLGAGNAPGMEIYKRKVVWGDKIVEYLRS